MIDAVLIEENLGRYCPITNHYQCADGRYLLVTYPRLDVLGTLAGLEGMKETLAAVGITFGPRAQHQVEQMATEVFLADASGCVIDADGDPANGMTPLLRCESAVPIHAALAQLGYVEIRPDIAVDAADEPAAGTGTSVYLGGAPGERGATAVIDEDGTLRVVDGTIRIEYGEGE